MSLPSKLTYENLVRLRRFGEIRLGADWPAIAAQLSTFVDAAPSLGVVLPPRWSPVRR